jgi:hypothetical protein
LDTTVTDESFADVDPARLVEGPARAAAVVPLGDVVVVDVADTTVAGDDTCVRRYEVGPGVDVGTAVDAAARWVR